MGWANAEKQPSPLSANILAAKSAVQNRTDTARAVVNEITVMRRSLDPSTPPPASLGKVPLIVLTSGKRTDPELAARVARETHRSVEDAMAEARIERTLQQELAALSSNGRQVIARKSGHFIMNDQPDLVVRSVRELLKLQYEGR